MQGKRRRCFHSASCACSDGDLMEGVLVLVLESQNWNPFLIAAMAQVCRWFAELAKRQLWRSFCLTRAPKMVMEVVTSGGGKGGVAGGWDSLARLMIYCAGFRNIPSPPPTTTTTTMGPGNIPRNIPPAMTGPGNMPPAPPPPRLQNIPPHFARTTRFSKTSGRSFLVPMCRSDVLYISDPCEHQSKKHGKDNHNGGGGDGDGDDDDGDDDDVGVFRGIFRDFLASATRRLLVGLHVELESKESCPYCFNRTWNLLKANMIPASAHRRLGAHGYVEYFVCLNGHLYGHCSLLHLSDSEPSSSSS